MNMKCRECPYTTSITGADMLKCSLTAEVRTVFDMCNCTDYRSLKDREKEVKNNLESITKDLSALSDKIHKPTVDLRYIVSILTDDTKEATVRINDAINYLEDFL